MPNVNNSSDFWNYFLEGQQGLQRGAIERLANDPEFQQMTPAQQQMKIAGVTGNPQDALAAINRQAASKLPVNDTGAMVRTAVQSGLETPEAGATQILNPLLPMPASNSPLGQINSQGQQPPATQPPAAQPPQAGTQPVNGGTPGINWDLINQYKQQRPLIGQMAESIVNGTFNPESGKGENDPVFNMALGVANQADPSLKGNYLSRAAMTKNITSGDMYKQQTNLNAAVSHVYDLHQMAPLINPEANARPISNSVGNFFSSNFSAGGNPNLTRYNSTLSTAAPEIDRYLSGGNQSVEGTKSVKENYDASLPAPQRQQNALDLSAKAMVRGQALQTEYDTALGNAKNRSIVQPETAALYKDMQGQPLTLQEQQLVNQHRQVANLPPKKWGTQQTVGQPVPPAIPQSAAQPAVQSSIPQQPKFTEGQALKDPKTGQRYIVKNGIPIPRGQ